MHIAVIGGGLAGLTCAKQALAAGYDVVVYEKTADVGGIWNPASGGAYEAARMQKLIDALENIDDVQEVYTTAVLDGG